MFFEHVFWNRFLKMLFGKCFFWKCCFENVGWNCFLNYWKILFENMFCKCVLKMVVWKCVSKRFLENDFWKCCFWKKNLTWFFEKVLGTYLLKTVFWKWVSKMFFWNCCLKRFFENATTKTISPKAGGDTQTNTNFHFH